MGTSMSQRLLRRANAYERKLGKIFNTLQRRGVISNLIVDANYSATRRYVESHTSFDYQGKRYRFDHGLDVLNSQLPRAEEIRAWVWRDLVEIHPKST
jgi:hypothetical protein